MERALARGGGAILVGGSGVGKSLLLATALERASDAGRTVLSVGGASWSSSGARAQGYGSLGECLSSLEPSTLGGPAADRPVVGIDDAHLVDDASGLRLHRLVAAGRLSVLATSRRDAPAPAGIDKLWVDRLIDHVDVAPFDRAALRDVLRARLGGHTDAPTLERLWAATHGNALMLRELVDYAVERGSLRPAGGVWVWEGLTDPPGHRLSEVIRLGLRDLGHEERELVNMLAVAEPLDLDIAAAFGLGHAAESLDLRGIVAVRHEGTRVELRLAVPLSRVVVASRMSGLTAQRLRRQVADAMESTGPQQPEDVLRVVSLRIEAGLVPEREQLLVAARAAVRRRIHHLAERLCLLALCVAVPGKPPRRGSVSDFGEGTQALCRLVAYALRNSDAPADTLRAALLLGEVLIGRGCHEEAEAVFDTALSAGVEMERAEYVAAVHARVVNLAWRLRRVPDAGAVLDRALDAVGPGEAGVLHGSRALIAMMSDRLREAVEIGEAVLRTGDVPPAVAQGLVPVVALARAELGDPVGASELLSRHRGASFEWDPDAVVLLEALAARCLWLAGNLREAADALDAPHRYDEADRWPALLQTVLARARLARLCGRPQRAVALLRQAVAVDTAHEWPVTRAWPLAQLAGALAESGQHAEALRTLVEARTVQSEGVSHPIADDEIAFDRALVLAHTGDRSGAASGALELADRAAAGGRPMTALAALHLVARIKENASYRFQARARQLAASCGGAAARAMADHIQALAEADGQALIRVSRQFGEMGALPLAAEAAAQAARAHRAAGQRRKGREAWAICEDLLSGGACALPAWTVNESRGDLAPLTPREREVAALAATGMSNRDIAVRLVVSVRTVENHLHRIYHKLGITARQALHRAPGQEPAERGAPVTAG
ncbi:helix-turn-helix transcriptional regulator [Streptomyces lichenis]|uniref:LuxR C-terminal-related transcriptional regulator n=1 Tax=Streptomyces lichenis TaxID=2306967 RepID=A0ABT0IF66_9ACTN|nr:LuxR family transcriptional regulator [Streptomyces lichenis]MCK8679954.1 LuxR C-terminal-related transcriptional regulator [Streptomyces lichenis]